MVLLALGQSKVYFAWIFVTKCCVRGKKRDEQVFSFGYVLVWLTAFFVGLNYLQLSRPVRISLGKTLMLSTYQQNQCVVSSNCIVIFENSLFSVSVSSVQFSSVLCSSSVKSIVKFCCENKEIIRIHR